MKLIAAALLVLFAQTSFACSCAKDSRNLELAYEKAETVALVRICEAHVENRTYKAHVKNGDSGEWEPVIEDELVVVASGFPEKLIKGTHTGEVKFNASNPNSNCHFPVGVGFVYLAFIDSKGEANIGYCSPTTVPFEKEWEFLERIELQSSNKSLNTDACSASAG